MKFDKNSFKMPISDGLEADLCAMYRAGDLKVYKRKPGDKAAHLYEKRKEGDKKLTLLTFDKYTLEIDSSSVGFTTSFDCQDEEELDFLYGIIVGTVKGSVF